MGKKSLKFKMVAGVLAVVSLPLIVIGVFSVSKASSALMNAGKSQAMHVAEDLAVMSNLYLESEIKFAKSIATEELLHKTTLLAHEKGVENTIDELKTVDANLLKLYDRVGDSYENFIVANAEGYAIAGNAGAKIRASKLNLSQRDYFQKSKRGEVNISAATKSLITGKPVVIVSVPIETQNGEFAGIFITVLKLDALSDKITAVKLGNTGYPFIVDEEGLTVVHPNKEFILELNLASLDGMKEIMSKMLNGEKGVNEYNFKGIDKIAGYVPISITGWSLGVTQNKSEFLQTAVAIRNVILIVGGAFLLISIVAVYLFTRSIVVPITNISNGLNKGAEQVASASTEVSKASQSLAEGSAEQAASIEESSSSLEEISSMTKSNAKSANEADILMKNANNAVKNANKSMEQLTLSMEEISKASKETSVIIKTIDEIAFQTNLLALNAAVEAARAGEAGAGFAVVADEVRNLAMRAAEAAKSTSERIEGTVTKVNDGAELVSVTSDALLSVKESSDKVGVLISEISKASGEQADGVGQINTGINQMNAVVQQNAATAEESASASEELNAQAEHLKNYVGELMTLILGEGNRVNINKTNMFNSAINNKPAYKSERRHNIVVHQKPLNNRNTISADEMIPFEDHKELQDF